MSRFVWICVLGIVGIAARDGEAQTLESAQVRLWDAAISGDTTAIKGAVTEGARVDSIDFRVSANGRRALNYAALYSRADAINVLLRLKAPLDARNLTGFTALHHAAEAGSVVSARALLAAGAKFDVRTEQGDTPLDVAIDRGNTEVAAVLQAAIKPKQ